jgi:hypothetical protein
MAKRRVSLASMLYSKAENEWEFQDGVHRFPSPNTPITQRAFTHENQHS